MPAGRPTLVIVKWIASRVTPISCSGWRTPGKDGLYKHRPMAGWACKTLVDVHVPRCSAKAPLEIELGLL
jgi:hypothetical protein